MSIKEEPVLIAGLARLVVLVAAKYGLALDATQLVELAVGIEAVVVPLVRRLVHPDAKVQAKIAEAHQQGIAIGAARSAS